MESKRRSGRKKVLRRNRTQQGAYLSLLLLVFVLFFGIVNLFAADRETSDAENRALAQTPELSWQSLTDGSYFDGVDNYLADQFVGRDFWISLRLGFARFMGASESNGVLLCDDDYLMEKPVAPNQEAVDKNLAAISDFAVLNPNLNICMSIVPTAACVMDDKLPANAPIRDQHEDILALQEGVSGVKFIDVTDALKAKNSQELYYRTDHHWTSLGAYHAFWDMADELEITPVTEYDIYAVSDSFEGTLSSKSGCHDALDTVELYVPKTDLDYTVTYVDEDRTTATIYKRDALNDKDHYTVFFGGNHPRVDIRTDANSGRTLLLFKDSYANCMVQFLMPYYDKIIMLDPRYYYERVDSLITSEKVTDVLFLYNVNTFHEDTSLSGVLK